MPLRKWLLFVMLFTIVALAASRRVNGFKANPDGMRPNAWLHASISSAAVLPWYGHQPVYRPIRWLRPIRGNGELPLESFVPAQFKDPRNLAAGKLLVASRSLRDPNFAGTVILLVHYDTDGVVGLVLNRRTDVPLSRIFDFKAAKHRSDLAYLGGPVQPSAVFALFQTSAKDMKAEKIFGGVYLISDKTLFEKIIATDPSPGSFHVYLGYAGWTQDQLRAEVQLGALGDE